MEERCRGLCYRRWYAYEAGRAGGGGTNGHLETRGTGTELNCAGPNLRLLMKVVP